MTSNDSINERDIVHSLSRGLQLITVFDAHHPSLTLDQVAARSSISRSACRRLLLTLVDGGYVSHDGRHFALTPRLLDLGYTQQSQLSLSDVAAPHAAALASSTDHHVSVGVLQGSDVMFINRVGGRRIMRAALTVGSRLPAHLTALGRAILAWVPEDELRDYIDTAEFRPMTPRSIRSAEQLRRELLKVRASGWSLVTEELEQGLSAFAVPIRDRRGEVVASINISTLASPGVALNKEVTELLPNLLSIAAAIGTDVHPVHTS